MDISVQTNSFGLSEPVHRLKGPRPDDLPISAAVWDAADRNGKHSAEGMIQALYREAARSRTALDAEWVVVVAWREVRVVEPVLGGRHQPLPSLASHCLKMVSAARLAVNDLTSS